MTDFKSMSKPKQLMFAYLVASTLALIAAAIGVVLGLLLQVVFS